MCTYLVVLVIEGLGIAFLFSLLVSLLSDIELASEAILLLTIETLLVGDGGVACTSGRGPGSATGPASPLVEERGVSPSQSGSGSSVLVTHSSSLLNVLLRTRLIMVVGGAGSLLTGSSIQLLFDWSATMTSSQPGTRPLLILSESVEAMDESLHILSSLPW